MIHPNGVRHNYRYRGPEESRKTGNLYRIYKKNSKVLRDKINELTLKVNEIDSINKIDSESIYTISNYISLIEDDINNVNKKF